MQCSGEVAPATWRWIGITAFICLAAVFLVGAASAKALTTYAFDPQLSLTGNCSKSANDEVEDPGCPAPAKKPSGAFDHPSVGTDAYGDIYVVNVAEAKGRIDVFGPNGDFITEFQDPAGPQSIAIDSEGNVYFFERLAGGERQIRRFPPTVYKPESGEIEYAEEPVLVANRSTKALILMGPETSLALDSNDRLYVDNDQTVALFGSAKEENILLEKETISGLSNSGDIAIDLIHKKIYLADQVPGFSIVRIFELEAPHKELGKITGSTTPAGKFLTPEGLIPIDVNNETGEVFVGDLEAANTVYQFSEDGTYLASIKHKFNAVPFGEIAVDDGSFVPNARKGYLLVPSDVSIPGHVYAFKPTVEGPPKVEAASAGEVTETEAVLHATINPEGLPTEYRLQYISQQQFEEEGESLAKATIAGEGTLSGGAEGIDVSAPALELSPGTAYRFRVVAENAKGSDEKTGSFSTVEKGVPPPPCENDALRIGPSALLPDCRAYELVTPASTNGHPPTGVGFAGVYFPTLEASPAGNRAAFIIEGGLIPGIEGTGAFNGDLYVSSRGTEGWTSQLSGPTGKEAVSPTPGSTSPDQTYSFWQAKSGSVYLHYPDGHSELVGQGSLASQDTVFAHLITAGGTHVVFTATEPLEPGAAPAGTKTLYDRAVEGSTHVVSLLPGNETPKAGEDAIYRGASEDGEGIVFEVAGTLYLRLHNTETLAFESGATFAGISTEGGRVFYLKGGDLFAFDAAEEETIEFSSSGDVTPVNVASDGTRAYFVSPSVLTSEPNPEGEKAKAGKENLYLSEEGTISFVGVLTERDVEGEHRTDGQVGGLGLWIEALEVGAPAKDPSRTTPAGSTLLFESRADLTGFESGGFAQVYRYDKTRDRLICLSCSSTGTSPTGDASLQSIAATQGSLAPFSSTAKIPNQSPDGARAFFQSAEGLALGDTDKMLDVYEWEEAGVGSCEKPGGCVYLISGGHSSGPDFLYAMSSSGNDVFFRTADILLPRDIESTLSIYDARVEGGFPEPQPAIECEAEGCHPQTPPPTLIAPAQPAKGADDQVNEAKGKHCPKGKHKVKRHHKTVCVKNHKKHHRGSAAKKKGGSR